MNSGLLLIRLIFGVLMVAHGGQKLFGWLGGYGIAGTAQFFEGIGFKPGRPLVVLAGLSETVGGLLLLLGFVQPLAAILIIAVMTTAIGSMHLGHGWFAVTGGPELGILYATVAAALTLTGPGAYSFDAIFGLQPLATSTLKFAAIAIGVVCGFVNLALRRPA